MDLRGEVEFLADDGRAIESDDDLVDFSPREFPRWAIGLCVLVVLAAVVTAVTAQGPPKPAAGPALPTPTPIVEPPVGPSPTSGLGEPLPLGPAEAFDALVTSDWFYALQNQSLTAITPTVGAAPTYARARDASIPGLLAMSASARLVLDAPRHRLWIVVQDIPGGRLFELDALTLQQLRATSWSEPIGSATALDGHLYFSTPSGVVDFAPAAAKPVPVAALQAQSGSIVADPRRGRLLVLDHAPSSPVLGYRPDGRVTRGEGTVPFGKGTLGVTGDGTIWAGGFGNNGAELVRLDARRLSPVRDSAVANRLGPGVIIAAAGYRSIWVRSGGGSERLWCVDGRTGRELQHWDAAGTVTSRRGAAYLATGTAARPLLLDGCTG
jgi:hypothetical protein